VPHCAATTVEPVALRHSRVAGLTRPGDGLVGDQVRAAAGTEPQSTTATPLRVTRQRVPCRSSPAVVTVHFWAEPPVQAVADTADPLPATQRPAPSLIVTSRPAGARPGGAGTGVRRGGGGVVAAGRRGAAGGAASGVTAGGRLRTTTATGEGAAAGATGWGVTVAVPTGVGSVVVPVVVVPVVVVGTVSAGSASPVTRPGPVVTATAATAPPASTTPMTATASRAGRRRAGVSASSRSSLVVPSACTRTCQRQFPSSAITVAGTGSPRRAATAATSSIPTIIGSRPGGTSTGRPPTVSSGFSGSPEMTISARSDVSTGSPDRVPAAA
jgi:hypothetical protein